MRPCAWLVDEFISTHRDVGENEYVAWLEAEVKRLRRAERAEAAIRAGRCWMTVGLIVVVDLALWGGALWLALWVLRLAKGGLA